MEPETKDTDSSSYNKVLHVVTGIILGMQF